MDMAQLIRQDARLIILRALSEQTDNTLHSGFLDATLRTYGIRKDRDWIHDELRWLAERGAVSVIEAGSVLVATLTDKGQRHIARELAIEGVKRPGLRQV